MAFTSEPVALARMFELLEKATSSLSVKPSMARAISFVEFTTSVAAPPYVAEKSRAKSVILSNPACSRPVALISLSARLKSMAGSRAFFIAAPVAIMPAVPKPIRRIASSPRLPKSSMVFITPLSGAES